MALTDLRARLSGALDPDPRPEPPPGDRLAGVLLPVLDGGEPWVLFTRRTEHLPRHAGEISFPGGLQHPGDPSLRATALRETTEELGIRPADVEVLGALPPVHTTVSGILIVPFVGLLRGRPALTPSVDEIAEVLEFPLARLMAVETEVDIPRGSRVYHGYAYEMEGGTIWGATARILHSLIEPLREGAS
ncbi:MAG: CoA pyrophosphatase [Candidatus Velamenicoccus archaeovorus]